jgi:hypothetical protein
MACTAGLPRACDKGKAGAGLAYDLRVSGTRNQTYIPSNRAALPPRIASLSASLSVSLART